MALKYTQRKHKESYVLRPAGRPDGRPTGRTDGRTHTDTHKLVQQRFLATLTDISHANFRPLCPVAQPEP